MIMSTQNYEYLHNQLFCWYKASARELPWRNTQDPYHILVSEIMLQQTQVSRVINKYNAFIRQFPNVYSLATAPSSEVIRAWSGMGYNKRAVNLHKAANIIVTDHNGEVPKSMDALLSLPGVGRYTASAISNFAFGFQLPVVDINIKRVLGRVDRGALFDTDKLAWETATKYLPSKEKTPEWNQSLMDLGAMVCTARNPECESCPLVLNCSASIKFISMKGSKETQVKLANKKNTKFIGSIRYYRGRIIESLRDTTKPIQIDELGKLINPNYSSKGDAIWLSNIISGLIKDGLINVQKGMASLP